MILNTILSYLDKRYFGSERKGKDPERGYLESPIFESSKSKGFSSKPVAIPTPPNQT
jgi:hypothetical protein